MNMNIKDTSGMTMKEMLASGITSKELRDAFEEQLSAAKKELDEENKAKARAACEKAQEMKKAAVRAKVYEAMRDWALVVWDIDISDDKEDIIKSLEDFETGMGILSAFIESMDVKATKAKEKIDDADRVIREFLKSL